MSTLRKITVELSQNKFHIGFSSYLLRVLFLESKIILPPHSNTDTIYQELCTVMFRFISNVLFLSREKLINIHLYVWRTYWPSCLFSVLFS